MCNFPERSETGVQLKKLTSSPPLVLLGSQSTCYSLIHNRTKASVNSIFPITPPARAPLHTYKLVHKLVHQYLFNTGRAGRIRTTSWYIELPQSEGDLSRTKRVAKVLHKFMSLFNFKTLPPKNSCSDEEIKLIFGISMKNR